MAGIATEEAFQEWLKTQPEQVRRVVAVRAALRAFPVVLKAVTAGDATQFALALLTGRANLTSAVVGTVPTADVTLAAARSAARSAAFSAANSAADAAAFSAARSAAGSAARSAAFSAARSAAGSAARSAARSAADAAAWSATYEDANEVQGAAAERLFARRLWQDQPIPDGLAQDWAGFLASDASRHPDWAFWRDWYQGFLDGTPMDFELQRRIALIENADWEQGAAHIAGKIDAIREEMRDEQAARGAAEPAPVTQTEIAAITQRVTLNRDAIALSVASIQEYIALVREAVRGSNELEEPFRLQQLDFLDKLRDLLARLLSQLPPPGTVIRPETAKGLVQWLREFWGHLAKNGSAYVAPKVLAEAVVPTGMIVGCTAIGAMLGMPLAGVAVGGLITGQIKPAKVLEDILRIPPPKDVIIPELPRPPVQDA